MDRSVDRAGPNSSLILRAAREADVAHLTRIERDADALFAAAGHPELADGSGIPDEVALAAIAQGRITVAELDGEPVGWVYLGRVDGELCVGQISVDPSRGRRGVGTALLRHVMEEARRAGEPSMVLNTQSDVPWNRRWYERHGFVVVPPSEWSEALGAIERDQAKHGLDWSTRVHMRLRLG